MKKLKYNLLGYNVDMPLGYRCVRAHEMYKAGDVWRNRNGDFEETMSYTDIAYTGKNGQCTFAYRVVYNDGTWNAWIRKIE